MYHLCWSCHLGVEITAVLIVYVCTAACPFCTWVGGGANMCGGWRRAVRGRGILGWLKCTHVCFWLSWCVVYQLQGICINLHCWPIQALEQPVFVCLSPTTHPYLTHLDLPW